VRRLVPEVRDEPLEQVYADLVLPTRRDRAWIALGMVATVDGAAALDGDTATLGGSADHHAFRALRGACDAILVGAGTVRAEDYGPTTGTAARRRHREAKGLSAAPRLVIVSGSLDLDPRARVFGDPDHRPLVVTHAGAAGARIQALEPLADVVALGEQAVDLEQVAATLPDRGLHRVLCEGGPTLNAALLGVDLVDELFLTLDPLLVGGDASRIVASDDPATPRRFRLIELHEHDGEVLLRYQRDRSEDGRT
jgi:riboflavin-specific deaminase-like protein